MPELYFYPAASHKPQPLLLKSSLRHFFQQVILQMAMQIDVTSLFLLFVIWEISPFHGAERTTSAFAFLLLYFLSIVWVPVECVYH